MFFLHLRKKRIFNVFLTLAEL